MKVQSWKLKSRINCAICTLITESLRTKRKWLWEESILRWHFPTFDRRKIKFPLFSKHLWFAISSRTLHPLWLLIFILSQNNINFIPQVSDLILNYNSFEVLSLSEKRKVSLSSHLNNLQERLQYSQLTHCVQQVLVEQGGLAEQVMANQKACFSLLTNQRQLSHNCRLSGWGALWTTWSGSTLTIMRTSLLLGWTII